MKTNELRLGNWVYDGNTAHSPMRIVGIFEDTVHLDGFDDMWEVDSMDLHPIPLTEEILLSIGQIRRVGGKQKPYYYYLTGLCDILCDKVLHNGDIAPFYIDGYGGIKYLHELQNYYFLLKKKEMEVEL